jgi:hypothetical protein
MKQLKEELFVINVDQGNIKRIIRRIIFLMHYEIMPGVEKRNFN